MLRPNPRAVYDDLDRRNRGRRELARLAQQTLFLSLLSRAVSKIGRCGGLVGTYTVGASSRTRSSEPGEATTSMMASWVV